MFKELKTKKAQVFTSEYIITLAIIIAALTVMSIFIKRTLQANIRNAREGMIYMIKNKASAFYENEIVLYREYEPYYLNTETDTDSETSKIFRLMVDGISQKDQYVNRQSSAISETAPPREAN